MKSIESNDGIRDVMKSVSSQIDEPDDWQEVDISDISEYDPEDETASVRVNGVKPDDVDIIVMMIKSSIGEFEVKVI